MLFLIYFRPEEVTVEAGAPGSYQYHTEPARDRRIWDAHPSTQGSSTSTTSSLDFLCLSTLACTCRDGFVLVCIFLGFWGHCLWLPTQFTLRPSLVHFSVRLINPHTYVPLLYCFLVLVSSPYTSHWWPTTQYPDFPLRVLHKVDPRFNSSPYRPYFLHTCNRIN